MSKLPFPAPPSNDRGSFTPSIVRNQAETPWTRCKKTDPQPQMFRIKFADGRVLSWAYSDLRETRMLHAGYLTLCIMGMEKYHIVLEGRNLTELAELFYDMRVTFIEELGPRTFDRPEDAPAINKVTVDTLTGPSP